jgi:hypothetical protein
MRDYFDIFDSIYEGFFDTDVMKFLQDKEGKKWDKLKISDEEKKRIDTLLAVPDARPATGDGTFEAWLYRISLWGKIKIVHNNPDEKVRNETMSYDKFLDYIDDQRRNAIYGKWVIEYPKINLVKFIRKFYSFLLGKETVEELIVEIDLREDLKAILKQVRKSAGLFGMF